MKPCLICGINRKGTIDRAHIIPKQIARGTRGLVRYSKFPVKGKNVIFLCKNHHVLFDSFQLTNEELQKLEPSLKNILGKLIEVLSSELKSTPKLMVTTEFKRAYKAFEKWKVNISELLIKQHLVEKVNKHGTQA